MDWRLMMIFGLFAAMHAEIFMQQDDLPTVQEIIMLPNMTETPGASWEG